MLTNDNDDKRMLFENCRLNARRVVNPIIDWTEDDVWDFLYSDNAPPVQPSLLRGLEKSWLHRMPDGRKEVPGTGVPQISAL